jgi:Tol biopolymer transport system component
MKSVRAIKLLVLVVVTFLIGGFGCRTISRTVPHEGRWGIYALDLTSQAVTLIYSSSSEIFGSAIHLDGAGNTLVFAQQIDGVGNDRSEICTISIDGKIFTRLTNNDYWDLYPVWSPDGSRIAFLSLRQTDLDIYMMNADGSNVHRFYDSGGHDADIDWEDELIAFTSDSRIWVVGSDGSRVVQITNPPRAGAWGRANLPFGDYDPRLNPDGEKIVFERLEADQSPHGNYDIYVIKVDGSGEFRLTDNGYSQGLASWSHRGNKIIYTVSAIGERGQYDLYVMDADGKNNHKVTPDYFPETFLSHAAIFSREDKRIFFIGEWWQ